MKQEELTKRIKEGEKYNVLLLDDNDVDNYIHTKLFERYDDFRCNMFRSAKEALDHLKETHTRYDYLLVDIYMPVMDGFTFVSEFKKCGLQQKHGEVCILTCSLSPADKNEAANFGIKYLEKPLAIEKILAS
ncbi:MAG: response regulator receiver protein CheY-like [Bacteroidota bacterium]|jgi:CheY-like chemotaxis protein|nr:response regulator receiver protein CheY-like [Bacteroidota bacterium]